MTTIGPYKGFQASVEYDDGTLFLKILHIRDSVTSSCQEAAEVIGAFREMVDDYIETCAALGDDPNRPFKGSFNVRVNPELHRSAAMAAAADDVSFNAWVEDAIRQKYQRDTLFAKALQEMAISRVRSDPDAHARWAPPQLSAPNVEDLGNYRAKLNQQRRA